MIQIYTGNGKGKTTAAIGISMRALGAGHRVYIMQFMKSLAYSEQKILRTFSPQLELCTTGKPCFVAKKGMLTAEEIEKWGDKLVIFEEGNPPQDYVSMISDGIKKVEKAILSEKYQMVVLDEINVALYYELVSRKKVEDILKHLPANVELVLTGRNAPNWLVDRADLVTEMLEVKHYYQKGVEARIGIEN